VFPMRHGLDIAQPDFSMARTIGSVFACGSILERMCACESAC
jgi:hypothetical protein